MPDLTVDLGDSLKLNTPLITASGTFGYGKEYADLISFEDLGAIAVKGISYRPALGNPQPRTAEVFGGMLNSIGLQNPGIKTFLHDPDYLPWLRTQPTRLFVNIWGTSVEEYSAVSACIEEEGSGIDALEINISCPNIKEGGAKFGTDLDAAASVVQAVRESTTLPLITKLSPDVADIGAFARSVADAGSDAISLVNTIPAMAIDSSTWRPKLSSVTGGMSGPAIKPIALRMVYEAAQAVDIPIIGMGGICSTADAVEFLLAGADAVGIGTALFRRPDIPRKIVQELNEYLEEHGCTSVTQLTGAMQPPAGGEHL